MAWSWDLGFYIDGCYHPWDSSFLFGSLCLEAIWILSLLDFMWISFLLVSFFFLSAQGTFAGDGHLSSCLFNIYLPFWGALHRHLVEKGYPQHSVVPVVAPCQ